MARVCLEAAIRTADDLLALLNDPAPKRQPVPVINVTAAMDALV